MKRYDLIVVGAGPSGLSAAIEAAKKGLEVVVFDDHLFISEGEKEEGESYRPLDINNPREIDWFNSYKKDRRIRLESYIKVSSKPSQINLI